MRILLVDDDPELARALAKGLRVHAYAVDVAPDSDAALLRAAVYDYDVVLLDVMLPGRDGFAVCRSLRERGVAAPVLMLTARDAVDDRIRGLEIGADDYLPKPFDFGELLARVRALLRRDKVHRARVIRVADLEIDTTAARVTRGGSEIRLTPREYSLLEALAANEGRVLTREAIQDRVWMDEESYSNTVDVHVGLLRKKIDAGHTVKLIRTVHGVGYVLRADAGEPEG